MLSHHDLVVHCHMSQRFIHPVNNRAQVYLSKNQDSTVCGPGVLLKLVITMQLFIFEERSFDLKELFCLLWIQFVMIQFCISNIYICRVKEQHLTECDFISNSVLVFLL